VSRYIRRLLWRLMGAGRLPSDPLDAVEYLDRLAANAGRRCERGQGDGGAR